MISYRPPCFFLCPLLLYFYFLDWSNSLLEAALTFLADWSLCCQSVGQQSFRHSDKDSCIYIFTEQFSLVVLIFYVSMYVCLLSSPYHAIYFEGLLLLDRTARYLLDITKQLYPTSYVSRMQDFLFGID